MLYSELKIVWKGEGRDEKEEVWGGGGGATEVFFFSVSLLQTMKLRDKESAKFIHFDGDQCKTNDVL